MANFEILSNNPRVAAKYPDVTVFRGINVQNIFLLARDRIHQGAVLVNHPLSGSVKPNESPYKSLVVSVSSDPTLLDLDSLRMIESAQDVLKKLQDRNRTYSDAVLEDFQVIDLDLLESAIKALPSRYHF
mgnify:CR=1 FL=1